MRILILGCSLLVLSYAPAMAVENFIPLGQNYAPGDDKLPAIGSEQDRINAQVDIYETEAYRRALREKQFDNRLNGFREQKPGIQADIVLDY